VLDDSDEGYGRSPYIIVYYSFDNKVQHDLDLVVDLLQLSGTCRRTNHSGH